MATDSMTTFNYIIDELKARLQLTDDRMGKFSIPKICDAINHAQKRVAQYLMNRGDHFLGKTLTLAITANQETYSIGTNGDFDIDDFMKLKQVLIRDASSNPVVETPLDPIKVQDRFRYINIVDGGDATLKFRRKYYMTTKSDSNSQARLPAIGIVPIPEIVTDGTLRIWYYFRPRPVLYTGTTVNNGAQNTDLPETVVPILITLTQKLLMEQIGDAAKLAMVDPKYAEEKLEAQESIQNQTDGPELMIEMDDQKHDSFYGLY